MAHFFCFDIPILGCQWHGAPWAEGVDPPGPGRPKRPYRGEPNRQGRRLWTRQGHRRQRVLGPPGQIQCFKYLRIMYDQKKYVVWLVKTLNILIRELLQVFSLGKIFCLRLVLCFLLSIFVLENIKRYKRNIKIFLYLYKIYLFYFVSAFHFNFLIIHEKLKKMQSKKKLKERWKDIV